MVGKGVNCLSLLNRLIASEGHLATQLPHPIQRFFLTLAISSLIFIAFIGHISIQVLQPVQISVSTSAKKLVIIISPGLGIFKNLDKPSQQQLQQLQQVEGMPSANQTTGNLTDGD